MDGQKNDDDDSPFQLNMDTLQASIFRWKGEIENWIQNIEKIRSLIKI